MTSSPEFPDRGHSGLSRVRESRHGHYEPAITGHLPRLVQGKQRCRLSTATVRQLAEHPTAMPPGRGKEEGPDRSVRIVSSVAEYEIQGVGSDQLAEVRELFGLSRSTRHCWCMAFCATRWQFATGWYGGGNQRRFEAMARSEQVPVGVLSVSDGTPVGWCACGPRARYTAALGARSHALAGRPRDEDRHVWLIACTVVRPDWRGAGVVTSLLQGAVSLARTAGASAVEAWPLARGFTRPGQAHVGRESVFARLGFKCIERPSVERVIMRLELSDPRTP